MELRWYLALGFVHRFNAYLNLASTDGVDDCASKMARLRFGLDASTRSVAIKSSVCTARESTLGVRDTLNDCLPPLRNMFDMSEFVELLQIECVK